VCLLFQKSEMSRASSSTARGLDAIQQQTRAAMQLSSEDVAEVEERIRKQTNKGVYLIHMLRIVHDPIANTLESIKNMAAFCERYERVTRDQTELVQALELSYAMQCNRDLHMYAMALLAYFSDHNLEVTIKRTALIARPLPHVVAREAKAANRFLSKIFSGSSSARRVYDPDVVLDEYMIYVDLAVSNLEMIRANTHTASVLAATNALVDKKLAAAATPRSLDSSVSSPPLLPETPPVITEAASARGRRLSLVRDEDRASVQAMLEQMGKPGLRLDTSKARALADTELAETAKQSGDDRIELPSSSVSPTRRTLIASTSEESVLRTTTTTENGTESGQPTQGEPARITRGDLTERSRLSEHERRRSTGMISFTPRGTNPLKAHQDVTFSVGSTPPKRRRSDNNVAQKSEFITVLSKNPSPRRRPSAKNAASMSSIYEGTSEGETTNNSKQ
jgi:hypothetical protein